MQALAEGDRGFDVSYRGGLGQLEHQARRIDPAVAERATMRESRGGIGDRAPRQVDGEHDTPALLGLRGDQIHRFERTHEPIAGMSPNRSAA